MKKPLIAMIVIFTLLLVWAIVFWQPTAGKSGAHLPLGLAEAPKGGDFTLHSANGPLSLHDLKGKVVLLYFGYTFCPDICPTSLAFNSQALATLDKTELDKVQMLFVSVDPERDTLDKLKAYTAYFHPSILGLSGTPEEIAKAAKLYGASYARQETGSAGGYVVDHSAYTYVIAPDGSLFKSLDHGTPPPQVVEAIRAAMKKG
ncbi:MAG: electron transport protein SCO1/SenC [Betaproteobacteria bacterium CG2_30_59_46]|nr:MAG: electron transport protein SCO1/SenC [Betaproteobacteria bacterium CG2_30_59_46]PIQ12995.1 MAG: electron transport protein SCO1/SenC [Hydrogenophilales bacterium CG18_big_fil_WC_8_21_14_2_50_58_12]PIY01369.1 MAG: SCO family protein [Hydrogenophilales bacterium CG_4_10_14_3_um_filter_58_23]PJB05286.1 MAG: SCO family protein [Hydrogenophilales bacterium CG_4_9_14_3_um_filter_59_35]